MHSRQQSTVPVLRFDTTIFCTKKFYGAPLASFVDVVPLTLERAKSSFLRIEVELSMQPHDDAGSAVSTNESTLSYPVDGNGSTKAESCATLEGSLSSLILLLRDKEDELKALRTKVDRLQEVCHIEILERTRLDYKLQSIESERQQVMKVHQLELDVALAQKNAAWSQMSASADKHRTEIHALQLKHAAELERLRQESYTISSSTPTLPNPRYTAAQHTTTSSGDFQDRNGTGPQIPPPHRVDESAFRKDLRKADGVKMAKLMSAGDSVSTATQQVPGNNPRWREARDTSQHPGTNITKVQNALPNRWSAERGTGIEATGPPTRHQHTMPPVTQDDEVSALTLQTFEQELNDRALDEQRWPRRSDEAVLPSRSKAQTTPQQGHQAEPPVLAGPTVQALKKTTSDGVVPMATAKPTDSNGQLLNPVPIAGSDWEAVHEEHVSVDQSTTTSDDDDQSGPSEVSTTYGEDQVKVVDKVLSDPYGDRGVYTGVVLLTTGMPHGTGRIQYADVGRSYDGEWRHGRW